MPNSKSPIYSQCLSVDFMFDTVDTDALPDDEIQIGEQQGSTAG